MRNTGRVSPFRGNLNVPIVQQGTRAGTTNLACALPRMTELPEVDTSERERQAPARPMRGDRVWPLAGDDTARQASAWLIRVAGGIVAAPAAGMVRWSSVL